MDGRGLGSVAVPGLLLLEEPHAQDPGRAYIFSDTGQGGTRGKRNLKPRELSLTCHVVQGFRILLATQGHFRMGLWRSVWVGVVVACLAAPAPAAPDLDAALEYAASRRDAYVSELAEIVALPSVSAQPERLPDLLKASQWMKARLETAGLQVRMPWVAKNARGTHPLGGGGLHACDAGLCCHACPQKRTGQGSPAASPPRGMSPPQNVQILETDGPRPAVYGEHVSDAGGPTILIYGHCTRDLILHAWEGGCGA